MKTMDYRCAACARQFRTDDTTYCPDCGEWVQPVEMQPEKPEPNFRPTIVTVIAVLVFSFIGGVFYIYVLRNP